MALQERGVRLVVENQSAFNQALAASNAAVNTLGTTSAGTARDIDTLTNRITFQERTLGILQQELAQTSQKYGESSIQAQKKQLAIDKLTTSIARDQAALQRLQTAEDAAGKSADRFGEVVTGAARRVGEFAVNALARAAQAVGAFIAGAISKVGDYEQSMNLFRATTGASAEEMQRAGALAKRLGADLTLPATSAADAGQAMTELAKAGLSVEQAMGAAKGTLQLAAAGNLEEAKAAEIAANALNTFGLAGDKATMVADLLAASANASSIEVTDAADSYKMAGAVWASLQGDVVGAKDALIDLTTAVGLLGNAGIKGSDAGTSLKQSLLQLAAPSDKAKGLMQDLAERVGVAGDLAYDASGRMRPFKQILELTAKSTQGMTQAQRDYTIATIFGADATRSILSLVRAGPKAWDDMEAAVTKQGAAADLAKARMEGLKGAAAGLESQIETLALEGIEPLLPMMTGLLTQAGQIAGSFVGQVGPGVTAFAQAIQAAAEIVQTLAIPALSGLGVASVAYGVVQLPAMIVAVQTATTAMLAQAAAIAAVALPLTLIAVTVAATTLAFQKYQEQIASTTDTLLNGKQFWTDATAALDAYGTASEATQEKTKPLADNLSAMQRLVHDETEAWFRHAAAYEAFGVASGITKAQLDAELATINQHAQGVQAATAALNSEVQAYEHLHDMDALEDMRALRSAQDDLTQGIHLSAEEMDQYQKKLDKAYEDGIKAVESYVGAAIKFHADLTKAIASGSEEQIKEVAASYAEQAAAARASLGQQLADWTVAYGAMNGVNDETTRAILAEITKTFGQTSSIGAATMLDLQGSIKSAMENGGQDVAGLGQKLNDTTADAIVMKQRMDELTGQYTAEIIGKYQNGDFGDGEEAIRKLNEELAKVPPKVYSEIHVHTEYTSSGERPGMPGTGGGGRATGGPVARGETYMVGERGPELFTPGASGFITPNHMISPPAQPQQIINVPRPQIIIMQPANTTTNYTTNNNRGSDSGISSDHLFALFGRRG